MDVQIIMLKTSIVEKNISEGNMDLTVALEKLSKMLESYYGVYY